MLTPLAIIAKHEKLASKKADALIVQEMVGKADVLYRCLADCED